MSALARRMLALALCVAAAVLAASAAPAPVVAGFALPVAAALVYRAHVPLGVPAQVLMLIGVGVLALLASNLAPVSPHAVDGAERALRPIHLQLGLTALLLAGLRLHVAAPVWGSAGTLGAGLLVFLAAGTVRTEALYPVLLVGYAAVGLTGLHFEAVAGGERVGLSPRQRWAGALLLVLTAGMAGALALAIPRFYHAAYSLALGFVGNHPVTGFHDGPLRLGVLHGMLQSSEVVARVHGDVGEHLRGNVYTHYQRGRWLPAEVQGMRSIRAHTLAATDPDALQARIVYSAADLDRFFLPTVPGRLFFSPEHIEVDSMGVVRTQADAHAEAVWIAPAKTRAHAPAPPGAGDLAVPETLAAGLTEFALRWAPRDAPASARVEALRRGLEGNNRYSLDQGDAPWIERGDVDPVLAFLVERRPGHCEYFASAMTLVARAAGLPARMVTGYRVDEINPWGGYAIVRERHAHAWSEVYVEGEGWVSVDPSPIAGTSVAALDRTPSWTGLLDYAQVQLAEHGARVLLVVLVVGLAGVQVRRIVSARRAGQEEPAAESDGPPEHVARLLGRLARAGFTRRPDETLESLARRVAIPALEIEPGARSVADAAASARPFLLRYAALRYGGQGDPASLRADIEAWLERDA